MDVLQIIVQEVVRRRIGGVAPRVQGEVGSAFRLVGVAVSSAPPSVNLALTKIRQVRRPAKHVRLERIKIRLSRMIVKTV